MEETPAACWEAGSNSCGRCDDSTAANSDGTHGNIRATTTFRCNGDPTRVITEGRVAAPLWVQKQDRKGEYGVPRTQRKKN